MPKDLAIFAQLFGILTLCCHPLTADSPTVISSSAPPIASLDNAAQLNEDNFTSAFPIVCTAVGCIEGIASPGFQIDEYESFFGIPYAEPPVGQLRFAVSSQEKNNNFHNVFFFLLFFLNVL